MRELGLAARARKRRKGTTRPGKGRWRAPDLVRRKFAAGGINRRWYGDGTEIVTGEGKLYLDSVLDTGSRRVLGYALGAHHDAALGFEPVLPKDSVCDACLILDRHEQHAVRRAGPLPDEHDPGNLHAFPIPQRSQVAATCDPTTAEIRSQELKRVRAERKLRRAIVLHHLPSFSHRAQENRRLNPFRAEPAGTLIRSGKQRERRLA